jgi:hypothetical protein
MDISIYRREAIDAMLPWPSHSCRFVADATMLMVGPVISDFASLSASFYDGGVLELEVYTTGVRDLNQIAELDLERKS